MVYSLIPINDLLFVSIPQDWSYQNEEKFRSANADKTISLTVSCYEKQAFENIETEFEKISSTYFATFDKLYKPLSELIKENRILSKRYNTGKTVEYHAMTYTQPMLTRFVLVCFVFTSIRNIEDSDLGVFETITSSLVYKVSDIPK